MGYAIPQTVNLEVETCCECSIVFAMPDYLVRRRQSEGGSFYCPNGHQQHYAETEVRRLKNKLAEQTITASRMVERARLAEEAEQKATMELKRINKRVHAGVCPCCNRTFQQLARHMKNKHPEQAGRIFK